MTIATGLSETLAICAVGGVHVCYYSTQPPHPAQVDAQHAAIDVVVTTLYAHPECTPFVLEFLETLIHDQMTGVLSGQEDRQGMPV